MLGHRSGLVILLNSVFEKLSDFKAAGALGRSFKHPRKETKVEKAKEFAYYNNLVSVPDLDPRSPK